MKACVIFCLTVVASVAMSFGCANADAAFVYLTGAQLYVADSNGQILASKNDYTYTTNDVKPSKGALNVWQGTDNPTSRAISFQVMANMPNTFFFESDSASPYLPGDGYIGMNLFFTDTDRDLRPNSYNPSNSSFAAIRAGEIAVYAQNGSATFNPVSANSKVQDYFDSDSSFLAKPVYGGGESFLVSGNLVTVTGFSVNYESNAGTTSKIRGSFTLSVTATPEPATLGLGALAACGLAGFVRKRWNNRKRK